MAQKETTLLTAIILIVLLGLVLLYVEGTPKTAQMPIYNTATVATEPVIYVDTPPVYWNYVPAWTGFYGYGGGYYGGGLPGWHHGSKIPGGGFGGRGSGSPPPPAPPPAPAPAPAPPSA